MPTAREPGGMPRREQVKTIFSALPPPLRRRLIVVTVSYVLLSAAEVAGILLVVPLVTAFAKGQPTGSPSGFLLAIAVLMVKSLFGVLLLGRSSVLLRECETLLTEQVATGAIDPVLKNTSGLSAASAVATLDGGTSAVTQSFILPLIGALGDAFSFLCICAAVFYVNPFLGSVATLTFVVSAVALRWVSRSRVASASVDNHTQFRVSFERMHSILLNDRVLTVMGRQNGAVRWFLQPRARLAQARGRLDFWASSPRYFGELTLLASVLVVLLVTGAAQGPNRAFEAAALIFVAGGRMAPAMQRFMSGMNRMRSAAPAVADLAKWLFCLARGSNEPMSREVTTAPISRIVVEGVTFGYSATEQPVLRDLSCEFRSGRVNIIVGPSGIGKSTLCDLILGLVSPSEGTIRVFGSSENQELPLGSVRKAYVPQQPTALASTVADNVTLSFSEYHTADGGVANALHRVGLEDWVSSVEQGEGYRLDSMSPSLSGGQLQRLCIARSLYQHASVLVLDEPTSALDAETANDIMSLLRTVAKDCLVIVVTHQASMLSSDDHVLNLAEALRNSVPSEIVS